MVRCPSCGTRFIRDRRYSGIVECPRCHARLRTNVPNSIAVMFGVLMLVSLLILVSSVPMRFGYYFWIFIVVICIIPLLWSRVEVVQQGSPRIADGYNGRQSQITDRPLLVQQNTLNRQSAPALKDSAWSYCIYCGTPVKSAESRFCTNCGASLPAQTVEPRRPDRAPRVVQDGTAGNCMVCSLRVRLSDPIAYCPRCGNVAHRVHMLQWLYLHKECPACGHPLSEQELETSHR
jgi:predicted RNA-binding Zn-ribbon protein involved in translation (DUF1610 family)